MLHSIRCHIILLWCQNRQIFHGFPLRGRTGGSSTASFHIFWGIPWAFSPIGGLVGFLIPQGDFFYIPLSCFFFLNRSKIRLILTKATIEKTESKISRLWQMLRLHYAAGMGWRPLDFDGSRGDLETNNNKNIFFMQPQSSFCMFFHLLEFYIHKDTQFNKHSCSKISKSGEEISFFIK